MICGGIRLSVDAAFSCFYLVYGLMSYKRSWFNLSFFYLVFLVMHYDLAAWICMHAL